MTVPYDEMVLQCWVMDSELPEAAIDVRNGSLRSRTCVETARR